MLSQSTLWLCDRSGNRLHGAAVSWGRNLEFSPQKAVRSRAMQRTAARLGAVSEGSTYLFSSSTHVSAVSDPAEHAVGATFVLGCATHVGLPWCIHRGTGPVVQSVTMLRGLMRAAAQAARASDASFCHSMSSIAESQVCSCQTPILFSSSWII